MNLAFPNGLLFLKEEFKEKFSERERYRRRLDANWTFVTILIDIISTREKLNFLRSEYTSLSDIYHVLGALRVGLFFAFILDQFFVLNQYCVLKYKDTPWLFSWHKKDISIYVKEVISFEFLVQFLVVSFVFILLFRIIEKNRRSSQNRLILFLRQAFSYYLSNKYLVDQDDDLTGQA